MIYEIGMVYGAWKEMVKEVGYIRSIGWVIVFLLLAHSTHKMAKRLENEGSPSGADA